MDPKRFLDGDDDAFETRLTRAARHDAPPPGASARAAAALGLAAGTATAAVGSAGLGASAAAPATKLGLLAIGKWFGVGIVAGLLATGGLHYASVLTSQPQTTTAANLPPEARPAPPTAPPTAPAVIEPAPEVPAVAAPSPEPAEPAVSGRTATRAHHAPRPQASVTEAAEAAPEPSAAPPEHENRLASLSAELAILQSARSALVAHDPERVLSELNRYSQSQRSGLLDSEAQVLRIEALVQAGRRAEAVSLAENALRAAPNGPHAARFRQIASGK